MERFNHFEGCVKFVDDCMLQCPWKLTCFKKKPWLVFQNLWGHGMRGVDPGWLVSNLFQPLQVHVFRDSSHHVEATTKLSQGKLYRHNPYVYPVPDDDEHLACPFFFLILGCGMEDFGCSTSYTHTYHI